MTLWHVEFTPTGESDLAKLDKQIRRQTIDRIEWLAENMGTVDSVPLHAQFKGLFKLRVGDWRVAYTFERVTQLIRVKMIDHRNKIYKRLK